MAFGTPRNNGCLSAGVVRLRLSALAAAFRARRCETWVNALTCGLSRSIPLIMVHEFGCAYLTIKLLPARKGRWCSFIVFVSPSIVVLHRA